MRRTSTSLEQRQIQDGHTDEVKKVTTYHLSSKVSQLSAKGDFLSLWFLHWENVRVPEWATGFPSYATKTLTNKRLLSHQIQYAEMCCKTRGVVTVRKEEPEKQQLGLLEGNKKMQFLLNALQAPSAKKEDKNKKKYEKDITTATTQNR